jgi:DNA replication protein DnaC
MNTDRRSTRRRMLAKSLLLPGPSGAGKTHLAVALGIKACEQGVRTLFISATALIITLGQALMEGRLESRSHVFPLLNFPINT